LRVRFPNPVGLALEAVTINTAGGIAGGDTLDIALAVGPGAALTVPSAAAEKVYRAAGAPARMSVRLDVAPAGHLVWLPQETILFDRAEVERGIAIDLAEDARLVLGEALVFGRGAMGEVMHEGRVLDRWRVRRAGRLVFADTLRLDGAIAATLGKTAAANGATAISTLLIAPGGEREVQTLRATADSLTGEAGISAWNGVCLVRLCAADSAVLRGDMAMLLSALGTPLPRIWFS
ncbi:MAG: urease accessory protein UreD, partial [Rhizobiales bacterium]|nr:urease accessory protein UreD [Hyphomicrobiales bacterium]